MIRFARSKLWWAVFLAGIALTAAGVALSVLLWPGFLLVPVVLIFPPVIFGGRRDAGERRDGNGDSHHGDTEGME